MDEDERYDEDDMDWRADVAEERAEQAYSLMREDGWSNDEIQAHDTHVEGRYQGEKA